MSDHERERVRVRDREGVRVRDRERETCLVDHKLGDPLVQTAAGAAQNHLQHVSIHLFHHHVDLQK